MAGISQFLSSFFGISAGVLSLLIGIGLSFKVSKHSIFDKGLKFGSGFLLESAIVLLAFSIDLKLLQMLSFQLYVSVLVVLTSTIFLTFWIGKWIGLSKGHSLLLGFGNGVCGNAAIVAASKITRSKDSEVASSIVAINLYSTVLVFLIPVLIHAAGNMPGAGYVVGASIQSLGHVAASAALLPGAGGDLALPVKMLRILTLVPALLVLAVYLKPEKPGSKLRDSHAFYHLLEMRKNVPMFILLFLVSLVSRSFLPVNTVDHLASLGGFLMVVALGAIGCKTDVRSLLGAGKKVLSLAFLSTVTALLLSFLTLKLLDIT